MSAYFINEPTNTL